MTGTMAIAALGLSKVIFLDEPTTGLDPRSRQTMWSLLTSLAASGVTVFLTTQYLEAADYLADRIAVLDDGQIVAEGTSEELKYMVAGQRLDLRLVDPGTLEALSGYLGARAVHVERSTLTVGVATDGSAADVLALLSELDPDGDRVARFSVHSASLDDGFMTLTGHRPTRTESETANV